MTVRTSDVTGRIMFVRGCFEPGVVRMLRLMAEPGHTAVDVGANIGQMTVVMSRAVGDSGAVHSFEPLPAMFEELACNVALNQLKNVRLNRLGLADRPGSATMHAFEVGWEAFSSIGRPPRPEAGSAVSIEIPVETLDAYTAEEGLRRVDLIKLDVEGAELSVVKGAEQVLRRHAPTLVFEAQPITAEGSGWHVREIWERLSVLGYAIFGLYPYASGGELLTDAGAFERHSRIGENFVAVRDPKERHKVEALLGLSGPARTS